MNLSDQISAALKANNVPNNADALISKNTIQSSWIPNFTTGKMALRKADIEKIKTLLEGGRPISEIAKLWKLTEKELKDALSANASSNSSIGVKMMNYLDSFCKR